MKKTILLIFALFFFSNNVSATDNEKIIEQLSQETVGWMIAQDYTKLYDSFCPALQKHVTSESFFNANFLIDNTSQDPALISKALNLLINNLDFSHTEKTINKYQGEMTDELKMKVFMLFIDREIEALQEKVTQEKRIEIFLSRITNHKKFYTEWNSLIGSDSQIDKTVSSYGAPKVVFLEEDLARVKFEKVEEIEFYFTKNNGNWCGTNTSVEPRLWDIEFE